jgi:murein DD-endopeptidase MepM/ murein hydrolase activator NlpD
MTKVQSNPSPNTRTSRASSLLFIVSLFGVIVFYSLTTTSGDETESMTDGLEAHLHLDCFPIEEPIEKYGITVNGKHFEEGRINPGQTLSTLLVPLGVSQVAIDQIARKARETEIFDVRQIRSGKPFALIAPSEGEAPTHFIYEPDIFSYLIFHFGPEPEVTRVVRPTEKIRRQAGGVIENSLWLTLRDQGLSDQLAWRLEDALAWSVDFYHIQKNAAFKVVFDEIMVDGTSAGVGDLYAAWFTNGGETYYAYLYESDDYFGYFDDQARPMRKAFLKAPVRYSRISSRFNPRRYHPILKRVKPHLGTDYAAPYGTEIYATADGTVIEARYTRGNGRYVKIRHDKTYETQYLHMQRFAKGMRPGKSVRQGDVIGYVGATGLATGPHVCYRFWKNGKQVDPLRQNLPPPEPMAEAEVPLFMKVRDILRAELDAIPHPEKISPEEEAIFGTGEQLPDPSIL